MNVNLIPEEQKTVIENENSNFASTVIAIILVGVSVVIALMLLSVTTLKKGRVVDYEKQIAKVKNDISGLQDIEKMVIMVETGLEGIEVVSANQLKWSKVIPWFENLMPERLLINNYVYNNNIVSISGTANSVESLNKFLISLEEAKNDTNGEKVFSEVNNPGYSKITDSEIIFTLNLGVEEGGLIWN